MLGHIGAIFLRGITTVYYHGSCPDGIGARQILKEYYEDSVKYIPYYFQLLPEVPSNSIFIDCSPKSEQLQEALEQNCIIVEHHASRLDELKEQLKTYPSQILYGEGIQSGTWLAAYIVDDILGHQLSQETRDVAALLALSDTWQKDDPKFEYARMLAGYIAYFSNFFDLPLHDLAGMTSTIYAYGEAERRKNQQLADHALVFDEIAFINELSVSNASEILRQRGIRLIVGWQVLQRDKINRIQYSLRSNETFDCSLFCKLNGGGGHKAAAGFDIPYEFGKDPINHFMNLYGAWEAKCATV